MIPLHPCMVMCNRCSFMEPQPPLTSATWCTSGPTLDGRPSTSQSLNLFTDPPIQFAKFGRIQSPGQFAGIFHSYSIRIPLIFHFGCTSTRVIWNSFCRSYKRQGLGQTRF